MRKIIAVSVLFLGFFVLSGVNAQIEEMSIKQAVYDSIINGKPPEIICGEKRCEFEGHNVTTEQIGQVYIEIIEDLNIHLRTTDNDKNLYNRIRTKAESLGVKTKRSEDSSYEIKQRP